MSLNWLSCHHFHWNFGCLLTTGVGGIWLLPGQCLIVYRHKWPDHIYNWYKAAEITNSNLEMAGILVAWFVLEASVPLRHLVSQVYSDNTPTVSWTNSLMSWSEHPTSSQLLRALAMRARTLESQVHIVPHWAGKTTARPMRHPGCLTPSTHISPPLTMHS
jgi:hypothetical protein